MLKMLFCLSTTTAQPDGMTDIISHHGCAGLLFLLFCLFIGMTANRLQIDEEVSANRGK